MQVDALILNYRLANFFTFILLIINLIPPGTASAQNDEGSQPEYDPKAAELVIQGAIFDLNDEYEKALSVYSEALIYEPNSASICNAVAKDYIRLGKIDTAIEMLRRSVDLDPKFLEPRQLLASISHNKGDLETAEKEFLEIVRLDSANISARINLAELYSKQGRKESAIEQLETILDTGRSNDKIHFELGNLYFETKEYDHARRTFRQYIQNYPEQEQGYLAVGAILVAQGDTSGATEWFEKTYLENHHFIEIREKLVVTHLSRKNWNRVIEIYKEATETEEKNLDLKIRLGEIYFTKGDTTQAISLFRDMMETHPDEWRSYYNLGRIYYSGNKYSDSIPFLQKAVEIDSTFPGAWYLLGLAYQQQNNLQSAEKKYRKAQSLAPLDPSTNFSLGNLLFQRKKFEEALSFLNNSLRRAPKNVGALTLLAATHDELGNHEKSDELYNKALTFAPDNSVLLNNYSYSLSERGERLEDALTMASKAFEAEPENGAFLDTIGWVHFKLGNYEKALEYINKSLALRNDSAEVLEHLGDVYEKMGQMDLAYQYWQQAKNLEPHRESLFLKLKNN